MYYAGGYDFRWHVLQLKERRAERSRFRRRAELLYFFGAEPGLRPPVEVVR